MAYIVVSTQQIWNAIRLSRSAPAPGLEGTDLLACGLTSSKPVCTGCLHGVCWSEMLLSLQ